jgi:hypothetical protein
MSTSTNYKKISCILLSYKYNLKNIFIFILKVGIRICERLLSNNHNIIEHIMIYFFFLRVCHHVLE